MNPLTLVALLVEREFLWGLGCGLACAAMVWAARGRFPWLAAWAGAAVVGLVATDWLQDFASAPSWALVPGLTFVALGAVGARAVERHASGFALVSLFALTVLGVWGTIPDTEGARVLMGVTAGMAPAALSQVRASGAGLALAVIATVVLVDGVGRPGSIVGALGCAGLLLIVPGVIAARRSREVTSWHSGGGTRLSAWLLVGAQVALVISSGRLAGTEEDPTRAFAIWAVAALAVGGAWWGAEVLRGRRSR